MLKNLLKDSVAYGVANAVQKLGPMVIIPVITGYLGQEAFKVYDVSFVSAYLFAPLVILGQDAAAAILYFDRKTKPVDGRVVFTNALLLQLACLFVFFCLVFPFSSLWARLLFSQETAVATWWQIALLALPGQIVLNCVLNVLLCQNRKKAYLLLCFIQTAVSLGSVAVCLLLLRNGIAGLFYSLIGSISVTALAGLFLIKDSLVFSFASVQLPLLKQLLRLGFPFSVTSFLQLLLPSIDRFFLLHYNYGHELAPYALAAKLGALMNFGVSAFVLAFTPYSMAKLNEENAEEEMAALFRVVSVAGFFAVPLLLLFKDVLIGLFADASYGTATGLLPFFFFGWVFDAFAYFTVLGVYRSQKSHLSLVLFAVGIVLISVLNILLVPVLGLYGAALSFCLCKGVVFFISLLWLKKHFHLRIHGQSFWPAFAAAAAASYLLYVLPLAVNIIVCLTFASVAIYAGRKNYRALFR